MEPDDGFEPLLLQAKQAQGSVLAGYAGQSEYRNQGERVVVGQQLMQAVSDIFLGWQSATPPGRRSADFYFRQLRDTSSPVSPSCSGKRSGTMTTGRLSRRRGAIPDQRSTTMRLTQILPAVVADKDGRDGNRALAGTREITKVPAVRLHRSRGTDRAAR